MSTTAEAVAEPRTDEMVSMRVVDAVADALGVSPLDLEPIHRSVDTDALDALYADGPGPRVAFLTNGCRVVVDEDGRVVVERPAED